jgi:hypothetical protein
MEMGCALSQKKKYNHQSNNLYLDINMPYHNYIQNDNG